MWLAAIAGDAYVALSERYLSVSGPVRTLARRLRHREGFYIATAADGLRCQPTTLRFVRHNSLR
jgi:hypothetical protein